MRLISLLFLLGCPSEKVAPTPTDTADSGDTVATDSVADTDMGETATDSGDSADTGILDLSVATLTSFAVPRGDEITDIVYAPEVGAFFVGDPYADDPTTGTRSTGAIWRLGAATVDLPADAVTSWYGVEAGGELGVSISAYDYGGEEVIASEDVCSTASEACDFAGRWMAVPTEAASGPFADLATLDIDGPYPGDLDDGGVGGYTGGYLGTASAPYRDGLLVSQTNESPSGYHYDGATLMALPTLYTDGVPEGGGGYVNMHALADDLGGVTLASNGGYFQHISAGGTVDWIVTPDGLQEPDLSLIVAPRDTGKITFLNQLVTGEIVTSTVGSGYTRLFTIAQTPGLATQTGYGGDGVISMADGYQADGLYWQAFGVFACIPDEAGEEGCPHSGYLLVRRADPATGEIGDDDFGTPFLLPFDGDYTCAPRVVSDGASTLAVICQDERSGALLTVR